MVSEWKYIMGPPGHLNTLFHEVASAPGGTVYVQTGPEKAEVVAAYTMTGERARLISAAPEMLAALKGIVKAFCWHRNSLPTDGNCKAAVLAILDAIKKGTGAA